MFDPAGRHRHREQHDISRQETLLEDKSTAWPADELGVCDAATRQAPVVGQPDANLDGLIGREHQQPPHIASSERGILVHHSAAVSIPAQPVCFQLVAPDHQTAAEGEQFLDNLERGRLRQPQRDQPQKAQERGPSRAQGGGEISP